MFKSLQNRFKWSTPDAPITATTTTTNTTIPIDAAASNSDSSNNSSTSSFPVAVYGNSDLMKRQILEENKGRCGIYRCNLNYR